MTRSRYLPPRLLMMAAAFAMASAASSLPAQVGMPGQGVKLKEPVASRVYQRDVNGRADIPIALDEGPDAKVIDATVNGPNVGSGTIKFTDGKLIGVPAGGPYTINCRVEVSRVDANRGVTKSLTNIAVGPVFVGDLWVLAGPVEHGGRRRPDRRHAAASPGHAAGHGRPVEAGRGAAALAGRLARPGPLGRSQDRAERVGPGAQEPHQGSRAGLALRGGAGRGDRRPDRPGRLRPRRHQHGAVEPGQEGRGRQEPLRLDAAAGPARRRQGQGRALVPGRERRQRAEACEGLSRRSSPTSSPRSAPTSASPSCRSTSSRSAGSSAPATPRAGTPSRKPSGCCPTACPTRPSSRSSTSSSTTDPRRHPGPEARRPAAGPDRRARALRPGRRDHADASTASPGARTTRWSSSSRASTWATGGRCRRPPGRR